MRVFEDYGADAAFLVEEVEDPRRYGVIVGEEIKSSAYIFKPIIYRAIEKTMPDKSGEVQLTDAINVLLNWQYRIYALKLKNEERRIDIGKPETYLEALKNFALNFTPKRVF